jgi:hypothetical protein
MNIFRSLGLKDFTAHDSTHYSFTLPQKIDLPEEDLQSIRSVLSERNMDLPLEKFINQRYALTSCIRRVLVEYVAYTELYRIKFNSYSLEPVDKDHVVTYINNKNIVFRYSRRFDETWTHEKFIKNFTLRSK